MMIARSQICIIFSASNVFLLYLYYYYYFSASKSSANLEFFSPYQARVASNSDGICIFYNFTQAIGLRNGPNFFDNSLNLTYEPITLCLHTTMDKVHQLWEHIAHWDDFISVSLLVRAGEEKCLARLARAWHCSRPFREKVSLHLVWYPSAFQETCHGIPDGFPAEAIFPHSGIEPTSCGADQDVEGERREMDACGLFTPDLSYPYTRMHNIARRGAGTRAHLVGDIDTAFSMHFAKRVRQLVMQHLMPSLYPSTSNTEIKKVLVFRRFEADMATQLRPLTIEALNQLMRARKANSFHSRYFPAGHSIPGLEEWMAHALIHPQEAVHLRRINYTRYLPADHKNNSHFEPQFISHASAPLAYEQTLGRHYTRQVLANELCRAGYEFWLLSHVFNVHFGVKINHTPFDLLFMDFNRVARKNFHDRYDAYLDERYPRKKECPPLHVW